MRAKSDFIICLIRCRGKGVGRDGEEFAKESCKRMCGYPPAAVRLRLWQCLLHGSLRRGTGRGFFETDLLERRQRTALECSGESGAPDVGDLRVVEVELLELRQPSSRHRRRT